MISIKTSDADLSNIEKYQNSKKNLNIQNSQQLFEIDFLLSGDLLLFSNFSKQHFLFLMAEKTAQLTHK